jgi:glycosyltransferase involved in cell wall biosynthesis
MIFITGACAIVMFTVIIPCYNAASTIRDALESLENQTYDNFEIICINDGSTDDTIAIISEYKTSSKMVIRLINQSNKGVSVARNEGLKYACGDYVVFLDADDCFHPQYLELMQKALSKYDADTAYCKLVHSQQRVKWQIKKEVNYLLENNEKFLKKALYSMHRYGFFCYVYRLSIIKRYDLEFPTDIKYGEDREFLWKYLAHCDNAVYIDRTLYWYRDNPSSAVNTTSWRRIDALVSVENTANYLRECKHPISEEFYMYMLARNILAVVFNFTMGHRKDLLRKLEDMYDIKAMMKYLKSITTQKHAKYAASVYIFSPVLFYLIVGYVTPLIKYVNNCRKWFLNRS